MPAEEALTGAEVRQGSPGVAGAGAREGAHPSLVAGDITQGGQGGGLCPGFSFPGPATSRQGLSWAPGTQLARSAPRLPGADQRREGGSGS